MWQGLPTPTNKRLQADGEIGCCDGPHKRHFWFIVWDNRGLRTERQSSFCYASRRTAFVVCGQRVGDFE
jgi:hypothetical protein